VIILSSGGFHDKVHLLTNSFFSFPFFFFFPPHAVEDGYGHVEKRRDRRLPVKVFRGQVVVSLSSLFPSFFPFFPFLFSLAVAARRRGLAYAKRGRRGAAAAFFLRNAERSAPHLLRHTLFFLSFSFFFFSPLFSVGRSSPTSAVQRPGAGMRCPAVAASFLFLLLSRPGSGGTSCWRTLEKDEEMIPPPLLPFFSAIRERT